MKKAIILFASIFISLSTVLAQDWQTDFTKAKKMATTEHKPIVLVFQGSDWCAPCIKLDREIWNTETFKDYAEGHYIMLMSDFPRRKNNALSEGQTKANAKLAEAYNESGIFPLVVVLDNNGKVLGKTGYKKSTPEEYIKELNSFIK